MAGKKPPTRAQKKAVKRMLRAIPKNRNTADAQILRVMARAEQLVPRARSLRRRSEHTVFLSRVDDLVRRLNAAAISKQPIELIKAEGRRYITEMIGGERGTIRSEFVKALFDIEKATNLDFFIQLVMNKGETSEPMARHRAASFLKSIASSALSWSNASELATKRFLGKKWELGGRDIEDTFSDPIMTVLSRSEMISRKLASTTN